jgi:hypothetical protein
MAFLFYRVILALKTYIKHMTEINNVILTIAKQAKEAYMVLANSSTQQKN